MNETGRRVREQYADTGGFTDHVFAACSILGYAFVPRIRDLPSKRLYVFERAGVPKRLRPLVGGKVNVDLIDRNWADILRVAATMAAGTMRPSQILRKLAAYPRQNEQLAAALREVGPHRPLPVHDRVDHGPRRAPARPGRLEQGRGAPCPQARHQLPPTRRTAGPNRGGAALPGRRAQPAGRNHHLLEHVEARRRRLRDRRSAMRFVSRARAFCRAAPTARRSTKSAGARTCSSRSQTRARASSEPVRSSRSASSSRNRGSCSSVAGSNVRRRRYWPMRC